MEDDVRQSSTDRYALSQAYRWKAERDQARQELERGAQDAENRRVELCAVLDVDPGTGWSDAMECMRRRLMPEGMEWPRYESGELVRIGDYVQTQEGLDRLRQVRMCREGFYLSADGCDEWHRFGERVKLRELDEEFNR